MGWIQRIFEGVRGLVPREKGQWPGARRALAPSLANRLWLVVRFSRVLVAVIVPPVMKKFQQTPSFAKQETGVSTLVDVSFKAKTKGKRQAE